MAISFGIDSPLGYSVFTLSAASFMLAGASQYFWSLDNWFASRVVNKKLAAYQASQSQIKSESHDHPLSASELKQIRAFAKISYRI